MLTLLRPRSVIARIYPVCCLGRRSGVVKARKRWAYTRRRADSYRAVERGVALASSCKRRLLLQTLVGPGWTAAGIVREAPSIVASRTPAIRLGGADRSPGGWVRYIGQRRDALLTSSGNGGSIRAGLKDLTSSVRAVFAGAEEVGGVARPRSIGPTRKSNELLAMCVGSKDQDR